MTLAATVAFCATLLVAPAVAAQSTDTSERFREAMSACVLPGPGLEPRQERLAEVGWQSVAPSARTSQTYADALTVLGPPEGEAAEDWQARRAEAQAIAEAQTGGSLFAYGGSVILTELQSGTDAPTCLLMTLNSRESELLFADLARFGAATELPFGRRGELSTTQLDDAGRAWRTDITVVSADADRIDPLLATPLRASLAATFVTLPKEPAE